MLRHAAKTSFGKLGRGQDHVLAIVEDQQQLSSRQEIADDFGCRAGRPAEIH